MSIVIIHEARQRLDGLFARIGALDADFELQSHWARYLCILVAGFVETSVRAVLSLYARRTSALSIVSYVETQLRYFQNPRMERIVELAGSFSAEWARGLNAATDGELKDSLDSVIANRNQIAHGANVGITYATMRRYYENAIRVVEIVQETCQ